MTDTGPASGPRSGRTSGPDAGGATIALVTPVPPDSPHGNGVTARRWADLLRRLGHTVTVSQQHAGGGYDLLVALHARKSAEAVRSARAADPYAPIVLALTGTDLYPDLETAGVAPDVLACADRLVLLQPHGLQQLPGTLRERARVIMQSADRIPPEPPRPECFEVAFLAHVRPVKDPLRPAAAARALPEASRVQVTHVGESRDEDLAAAAAAENMHNPRYTWLGPRPREEALGILARSRALLLTSLHEGGANVISEALAAGVPVLSSRIPGSVALLGEDYPGYFPPGDTQALAGLLERAESDHTELYGRMREHWAARADLAEPAREQAAWARLLAELALPAAA